MKAGAMRKTIKIFGMISLLILQSCYFGAGLVEEQLTDDIELIAINSLDEAEIIYSEKGNSVYYTLVQPTVLAVGRDDNFIIAKTRPIDFSGNRIYYHIVEVRKVSKDRHEKSIPLTAEQFESERRRLRVPKELDFTINLEQN
jgi:hypothetical protein